MRKFHYSVKKSLIKQRHINPYTLQMSLNWVVIFVIGGLFITLFAHAQNIYTAPSSISSDCSRDVSADINNWIKSVPNDSLLQFTANGCYKIEGSLALVERNGLTIQGQGATFKSETNGTTASQIEGHPDRLWPRQRAHWFIKNSSNIVLSHFNVDGPNADAGPTNAAYHSEFEEQHGVMVYSSNNIAIENCQMQEPYGDFVSAGGYSAG